MPKFEMVGLTADLAFAGNSGKGGNFEFADLPKTTFTFGSNKFSRDQQLAYATNNEINATTQAS